MRFPLWINHYLILYMTKPIKKIINFYKCQFCLGEFPEKDWLKNKDKCPGCGQKYDALLAQEGDD